MANVNDNSKRLKDLGKTDTLMEILWVCVILSGLALCGILLYKVIFHKPHRFDRFMRTSEQVDTLVPTRGDILDTKGRILATSTMIYNVYLDLKAPEDTIWNVEFDGLCKGLSEIFPEKSEQEYRDILDKERKDSTRYFPLRSGITQMEINKVRKLPVFKHGRYKGGYREEGFSKRMYPYKNAAYRTIGRVKNNIRVKKKDGSIVTIAKSKIGIEGQYDSILHGTDGIQIMSKSDFGMIPVADSANVKEIDGLDIRTTIDADIQTIADAALRRKVEESDMIEKSCVIVMEAPTGAIRAISNLHRNEKGEIREGENFALCTAGAPGSVFKGAVMMALLEDGYVTTFEKEVLTYGGKWTYNGETHNDVEHLGPKRFPSGKIRISQAFEMSANNTFRQLVCDEHSYGNNPARFVKKIKSLGIIDTIDFDLKGIAPPFILDPSIKKKSKEEGGNPKGFWDNGTLARLAIGYGMELSPLSIVNFYNTIACGGKMMKPYLIEAFEKNGQPVKTFQPTVMHERICSKATADTLKKAMTRVTSNKEGTAYRQLHEAVCPIAGKTGTAQRLFKTSKGYKYKDGNIRSHQATFVGFFPPDKPEYTAIVVMWCKPSNKSFFGATYSAPVFREIADKIYCLNDNL